jgi:hypothetical protein
MGGKQMTIPKFFTKQPPISDDVKLVLEAINKWEGEIVDYGPSAKVGEMCGAIIEYGNETESRMVKAALKAHNLEAKKILALKRATETAAQVLMGEKFEPTEGAQQKSSMVGSGVTGGPLTAAAQTLYAQRMSQNIANQMGQLGALDAQQNQIAKALGRLR